MSGESGRPSPIRSDSIHITGAARWCPLCLAEILSNKLHSLGKVKRNSCCPQWYQWCGLNAMNLTDTHPPQKMARPPRNKHDRTWLARLARNSCKFSRCFSHDGDMSNALCFLGGEAGSKSSNLKGLEVHNKRHTYCFQPPLSNVSYPLEVAKLRKIYVNIAVLDELPSSLSPSSCGFIAICWITASHCISLGWKTQLHLSLLGAIGISMAQPIWACWSTTRGTYRMA